MLGSELCGNWADHIDAKIVLLRIFECGLGELRGDSVTSHVEGHFRMPDRHPALAICFKFQVRDFAALLDFEPASCDLVGLIAHGSTLLFA